MSYALMLATPGDMSQGPEALIEQMMRAGGWTFEFKMDGIRALVQVTGGAVQITNRNGRHIGYRYPDVLAALDGYPRDVVLDGEIVSVDGQGRPDFSRIHRRDAQVNAFAAEQLARALPAQFVVFDVLAVDGVDLRALDYLHRRAYLDELAEDLADHGISSPPVSTDGAMAWQVVQQMGLEGLVAKRNDSRYVGRRSPSWVKIKATRTLSALVSGYDPGTGSRASTFGALRLSLLDEVGALVDVGSVGSGFTDLDVRVMWDLLHRGQHPIVVEVSYLEVSPTGQLRQPVFKGRRMDVDADSCTTAQLR